MAKRWYIVHAYSNFEKKVAESIRDQAKQRGLRVTCEVTPHHFTLIDEDIKDYDTNYKMKPPLRSRADREALLQGFADGTVDAIGDPINKTFVFKALAASHSVVECVSFATDIAGKLQRPCGTKPMPRRAFMNTLPWVIGSPR